MIDEQAPERPTPAVPQAAAAPRPPVTGDPEVDAAVARLADLPELDLADHPTVFEAVHRTLTDRLSDVEG